MSCRTHDDISTRHLDLDAGPHQKHAPAPGGGDPIAFLVLLVTLVAGAVVGGVLVWRQI